MRDTPTTVRRGPDPGAPRAPWVGLVACAAAALRVARARARTGARAVFAAAALAAWTALGAAAPPPGTAIYNVAHGAGRDSASGAPLAATSNPVRAVVQAAPGPPALAFYADPGHLVPTTRAVPGQPLWLAAVAPACDTHPARRDTVALEVTSDPTGDFEVFLAIESAPSSGVFRVEPAVATARARPGLAAVRSGVLEFDANDAVTAVLWGCGAPRTEARAWAEPAGTVFDARTGAPVAGARVLLLDVTGAGNGGDAGGPARVFLPDGVTPAPAEVTTGPSGRFEFPALPPSVYRLVVAPPAGLRFPSAAPPASLPATGRLVDPAASYGGAFSSGPPLAPVRWSVPLDALPARALFARMRVAPSAAEIGDVVEWTVDIESRGDDPVPAVSAAVALPAGFRYLPGSARRDTAALAEPALAGADPVFALGALGARATARLAFRTRVGPGALDGDGVARAVATADTTRSNEATARVVVTGGAFADEAMISGTVFVDRDRDGRRGPGEPGMPGVRVWLDDGTFAITDRDGRYSLYGLEPRARALRLDRLTLPAGAAALASDRRDFGTPGLRLADLQRGELHRADFPVAGDSTVLHAAAARAASGAFGDELARGTLARGDLADGVPPGDPKARPASGVVGGESRLPLFGDGARGAGAAGGARPAPAFVGTPAPAPAAALEDLAAALDGTTGFVDLADGDTLGVGQIAVRVKGAAGLGFELHVNGAPVPAARVGRKVAALERGVEAWEFVGVALRPGVNLLTVAQRGAGGRGGGHASVRVTAPGRLARVEVTAPRSAPADGHSIAALRLRVLDAAGVPLAARTIVTLEATAGRWQVEDLDPATPGVQVAVEGGETAVGLLAPAAPAVARVRATAGAASGEAGIAFVPELRPLLAVGVAEGTVAWSDLVRGRAAARPRTGFETEAGQFRAESRDGERSADARAALFVQGRVAEDVQLTLGYATDKPADLRRFRDVQPDAFYPVYGDASVRGYEAQSTGRLHARLDRRGASLGYGDFLTRGAGGARSLAAYDRSLTGAHARWEGARLRLDAFSSRDRARRRVEEVRGLGASGPYLVPGAPAVENSERVEIVTRDRDRPSVVLRAVPRARFTDYEFDPYSGRLLFKSPVPSVDADLNPVWVRVTFEVESGGAPFWVSGGEARVRLHDRLEAGGTYVDDHDPLGARELRGAFVGARLGERGAFEAEWAATRAAGVAGDAGRFELRHEGAAFSARAFGSATDAAFDNPGAGFGPGRIEGGGRLNARLSASAQVRAEALYTADAAGGARRGGGLLAYDRALGRALRGELGVRVAGERRRGGGAPPSTAALRARLQAQWPGRAGVAAYAEGEQNLTDARRMLALGGEARPVARARLYARHELISSLAGPYALDAAQRRLSTVAGVDADLEGGARAFGEMRGADPLAGREAEAAVGLRNAWRLAGGARVGLAFERVSALGGGGDGATTALSGSIEHAEDRDWRGSSRLEVRTGRATDAVLHTLAAAVRLDSAWTALGRELISVEDRRRGRGAARLRLQTGLAYRQPRREDWDALGRYELRFDRQADAPGERRRRVAHVVSTHATGRLLDVFTVSGGWAGKRVSERSGAGDDGRASAQRVHGRLTWAFGRDWDAGVHGSLLSAGGAERRHGLGVEAGRQLGGGVWLSAGWNRFGYEDDDFPDTEWTREGAYLRIRARFDETLLGPAGGAR
uniref:DUF11 domain-containing protein n=1 Tax=Eiseniibacteriota bacterium TaxID=2212470 RepID=A0A832I1U3_UNCEI